MIRKWFLKLWYRFVFGVKVEKGHKYTIIQVLDNDKIAQRYHEFMLDEGWEKETDLLPYMGDIICVYKQAK